MSNNGVPEEPLNGTKVSIYIEDTDSDELNDFLEDISSVCLDYGFNESERLNVVITASEWDWPDSAEEMVSILKEEEAQMIFVPTNDEVEGFGD